MRPHNTNNKNPKVILINLWDKGGMRHYSDALSNLIKQDWRIYYFSNYGEKRFKINLNPLNPRNYFELVRLAYRIIKVKPKVIHVNSGYPLLVLIYPLFLFYNSIITIHDAKPHEGESRIKVKYHAVHLFLVSLFFRKIIVHSELIKNELPRLTKRKRVYVIPHMRQHSIIKRGKKEKSSKFRVLFFGRILEYKGLSYLLEAFKELPEDKYELTIAGEGKLPKTTMGKNVNTINRFIKDQEISTFFTNTDIVALPYISASQSGIVYLSYAFNKPVIASKVGAIPEIVKDKVNGLLIKPKSVKEISKAIKYLNNKIRYDSIVRRIKKQNLVSDDRIKKKLLNAYTNELKNE